MCYLVEPISSYAHFAAGTYAPFVAFVHDSCAALLGQPGLVLDGPSIGLACSTSRSYHSGLHRNSFYGTALCHFVFQEIHLAGILLIEKILLPPVVPPLPDQPKVKRARVVEQTEG